MGSTKARSTNMGSTPADIWVSKCNNIICAWVNDRI